jgi:archaeosine synthase
MIEVLARDGLAREMKWTVGDHRLATPNILFLRSGGIPPFSRGECFLSDEGAVEGKFNILSGGSWFLAVSRRAGAPPGITVPPFPNIPAGLEAAPGEAFAEAVASFRETGSAILPVTGVFPPDIAGTGAELFVFAGALEDSFRPRRFAEELVRLKEAAGYGKPVYAPGLGEPAHIALLAYCGVDLFDSAPLLAAARRGVRLFPGWSAGPSERGVCHCPACECALEGPGARSQGPGTDENGSESSPGPCPPAPGPFHSVELVYEHNCYIALSEVHTVRSAIAGGRLRELVENRLSDPWLVSTLRHLDLRHADFCERYFPVARPASGAMRALSHASLTRPEIARFRKRVLDRYRRPPSAPVLLLLPCSARKPYSTSLSHRLFRAWIDRCKNPGAVHEVVVTSPLGVVPVELESFYPAGCYDVPVTGDWDEQETRMMKEQLGRFISSGRYSDVVCHISGMDFLNEVLPPTAVNTAGERATAKESLEAMREALDGLTAGIPKVRRRDAVGEKVASLARFQFGEGGGALAAGCDVRRRGPDLRITDERRTQLALLQHERGLLSLTMDGARRLLGRTRYEVEIGDFKPSGTVFAPGVLGAGKDIRPGDEVLVARSGELRGVGVALMSAAEMLESKKGGAVRMRHHVSSKEKED